MMKMRTYTGKMVDVFNLKPKQIDIQDIAHSLSLQNRFNGHTKSPVSVAFHSIIVASGVKPEYQLQALLHDAAEAYIGDLITPVKYHPTMHLFKELEDQIEEKIFARFGVEPTDRSFREIKKIDRLVRVDEANRYLVGNDGPYNNSMFFRSVFLGNFEKFGGKP